MLVFPRSKIIVDAVVDVPISISFDNRPAIVRHLFSLTIASSTAARLGVMTKGRLTAACKTLVGKSMLAFESHPTIDAHARIWRPLQQPSVSSSSFIGARRPALSMMAWAAAGHVLLNCGSSSYANGTGVALGFHTPPFWVQLALSLNGSVS